MDPEAHGDDVSGHPAGGSTDPVAGGAGLDADRLLAEAVSDAAADARRRERLLRERLLGSATIAGVLAGAVGTPVALVLVDGLRTAGTVDSVGADAVAIGPPGQPTEVVALDHVAAVSTRRTVAGAGPAPGGWSLAGVLADEAGNAVELRVAGTERRGEVVAVGDLVVLRDADGVHHVRIEAISRVRRRAG